MTAFGVCLLPLCLYFWREPARLLELVLIGSVFAAAAVIVVGNYGVMPALIPAVMFQACFLLNFTLGERFPAEKTVLAVLWPFIVVVAGAVVSSVVMPRLFEGRILVWPQKLSGLPVISPLAPNFGNYTQDMYLLVNAGLAATAAIYLTRSGFNLRRLLDTYFVSGLIAVTVALWQFASNTLHIWFPTNFFLSNPGWALLSTQTLGSLVRLNGTFSEPSSLAGYLCGSVSAAAWVMFNGDKSLLPRLLLVSGLGVVLLCTAATGYVTLAIMASFLLVLTCFIASPALKRRVAASALIFCLLTGLAAVTLPVLAPGIAQEAGTILSATLDKQQSSSFSDRTTADWDSIKAMLQSGGLGVGWGSSRSSSLFPGLCASVGVWGILGLLLFIGGLLRHVRIAQRLTMEAETRLVMHGCCAGLLGMLVAALVSGPSITSPDFYVLLALLTATAARVRHEAQTASSAAQEMGRVFSPLRHGPMQAMKGRPPWPTST
jgi:hypothetical protein